MKSLLVMAYGTPSSDDELEAYYTDIRRGRPPTPEQLADLRRRYDAIGGLSPLAERTERQATAIAAGLGDHDDVRVSIGYRHTAPSIEDAAAELVAGGSDVVVGLVLAPHYSSMSVARYHERAVAAVEAAGAEFVAIDSWATEPAYLDYLAGAVRDALAGLPAATRVIFTAHSLPQRILEIGDPYPAELVATATAVAEAAGLGPEQWEQAWQSAGRTPEPWLGPDILERLDQLATAGDVDGVLVCPCGFVADHLEVLYDLDIEAAGRARELGLAFARTATVNDEPTVMAALAAKVVAATVGR